MPHNWLGSCYLGYVVPYIHILDEIGKHYEFQRTKREVETYERVFGVLIAPYGVGKLMGEVTELADLIEKVANETEEGLSEMSAEMVAMRVMTLQNRMALDYLLADKGGTCALIGSECCTYIPDSSENITNIVKHIRDAVSQYKNPKSQGWFDWMLGGWLGSMGQILLHGLVIVVAVFVCISLFVKMAKCCCDRLGKVVLPEGSMMVQRELKEEEEDDPLGEELRRLNKINF